MEGRTSFGEAGWMRKGRDRSWGFPGRFVTVSPWPFEADCFSRIDVMGQQQRNPSQKLQVFMSAGSVPRTLPVVVC